MNRNGNTTLLTMSGKNQVAVYKCHLAHESLASLKPPRENPVEKTQGMKKSTSTLHGLNHR